ncbi:MAG TPA: hypothetical protein VF516_39820, partial [Kofleriaceae bacterium]
MIHDDATPRTLYTVELTLTADPAIAGRATLRIASRGRDPVTVAIPERPGGERAAIAYTILGSCRLAGVDPREYLADVLPRLTGRIRLVDLPALL